LGLGRHR